MPIVMVGEINDSYPISDFHKRHIRHTALADQAIHFSAELFFRTFPSNEKGEVSPSLFSYLEFGGEETVPADSGGVE